MNKGNWENEIINKKRFKFGKNWLEFAENLNNEQLQEAKRSLQILLNKNTLDGKTFLDIGCGSGLSSLAAKELGAKVFSFDYDKNSVFCTKKLKAKFRPNDKNWHIQGGSILDNKFLESIGKFDIVYSWGVIHHTGNMIQGLENVLIPLEKKDGSLAIAIYNDQGFKSNFWKIIKKSYNSSFLLSLFIKIIFIPIYTILYIFYGTIFHKNPFWSFINYKKSRGMAIYYDWVDWLGGYPYEVAKPEVIFSFFFKKGYILKNLITTNSLGCNQYLFSTSKNPIEK